MERNACDIAVIVWNITEDIRVLDSPRLATYMCGAFGWLSFAEEHPDMTAEEIASAAADGFDVKGTVQYEVV